ncbi:TPA: hypothetical protein ACH3X3_004798 [Trebouxia sp. C0006]
MGKSKKRKPSQSRGNRKLDAQPSQLPRALPKNSDNARISRLSPSLSKSERLEEAKKTWQRLSETERDNVFILPLQELFESAALLASAHCADPGALPDYLEKQGDVNKGTDYQTLLTSAVQLFRKLDEHKTWRWIPNSGTMCLTEADLRAHIRAFLEQRHSDVALRQYLPEHKPAQTAYQTALRHRMNTLLHKVLHAEEQSDIQHVKLIFAAFAIQHKFV